jgi:glycosyltransferase involved in cell wall biosynthesis
VVRIITRLNIGGPAIHTTLLSRELAGFGYRTTLVTGRCESEDADMSYLLRPGDRVIAVSSMSRSVDLLRNLRALWEIWRIIRREKPWIVHTHTAMAGCLGRLAAWMGGAPVIVHTFHGNSLSRYFSPLASGLFRRIEQLTALMTDAICVVAPQQVEELSGRLRIASREKFRVLPLGLELEPFLELAPPVPGPVLTVGWLGRLVEVKNVALLRQVVEEALRRTNRIRFLVAGDGPDRGVIEEACRKFPGNVEWLGWRNDVLPVISRCDLMLQTSRNEGTPVALIQGMAAARPFLSTPVGGIPDMAGETAEGQGDGFRWCSHGVLAEARPEAFAGAILSLMDERERIARMGLAARAAARERHRKQALTENMDRLYRELLERVNLPQPPARRKETNA